MLCITHLVQGEKFLDSLDDVAMAGVVLLDGMAIWGPAKSVGLTALKLWLAGWLQQYDVNVAITASTVTPYSNKVRASAPGRGCMLRQPGMHAMDGACMCTRGLWGGGHCCSDCVNACMLCRGSWCRECKAAPPCCVWPGRWLTPGGAWGAVACRCLCVSRCC